MTLLFSKDTFTSALKAAPLAVQQTIQSDQTTDVIDHIRTTNKLHVDTAGNIAAQVGYMLLGLLDPKTFYQNLIADGINPGEATAIVQEINEKIFLPLQERIRNGSVGAPDDDDGPEGVYDPSVSKAFDLSKPSVPAPQVPLIQIKPSQGKAGVDSRTSQEIPPYNLIGQKVSGAPVFSPPPAIAHSEDTVAPATGVPMPTMRTMQHDMELVQHGSMPAPYPVAPAQLHPAQATPARTFQTASVPVNIPSARPQPAPEIVHIVPDAARQVTPQAPQAPSSKEYTADPYRETV